MLLAATIPLLLTGCSGPDPKDDGDSADTGAPPDCTPEALTTEPLDVPAGHRVFDVPVPAPWLPDVRSVPLHVWYPTDATEGTPTTYIQTFLDDRSFEDAPFADPAPGCKLPLVVYSHGSQAWAGNNSPLLRQLVGQGWVAVAPDHVDNTLIDNVDPKPVSFSLTRVADIRAALDAVEALPEGDPLYDRVDTSRVIVVGHSYGGQTSWLLAGPTLDAARMDERCDESSLGCSEAERAAFREWPGDPRLVGAMPLDGFASEDLVAAAGWADAGIPILYLSKAEEGDTYAIETAAAADVTWARFDGACHETFTDSPVDCSTFDKQEGQELTAAFLTAFAATRVLGLDDTAYTGILDGSTSLDERITITTTR